MFFKRKLVENKITENNNTVFLHLLHVSMLTSTVVFPSENSFFVALFGLRTEIQFF